MRTVFSPAGPVAASPSNIVIPDYDLEEDEQTRLGAALAQPAAEIAAHEVSHIPYRAWCTSRVRGRAKSQPRRSQHDKHEDRHPVVSIDYAFFSSHPGAGDAATSGGEVPVLIVFDRRTKCVFRTSLEV